MTTTGLAIIAALTVAVNLTTAHGWGLVRGIQNRRATYATAAKMARQGGGPILSNSPLLPVLAGQRPFLLDPWMFQLLDAQGYPVQSDLQRRIGNHEFSAVVVNGVDSRSAVDEWLGSGTYAAIGTNYPSCHYVDQLKVCRVR